jgi:ribonuclease HII
MARRSASSLKIPHRPTLEREKELRALGYQNIVGVDEAGRGPLAGPVVAGAVLLPPDFPFEEFSLLNDSKQLKPETRAALFEKITQRFPFGVGVVDATRIDEINIRQASWLAMQNAVADLKVRHPSTHIDYVLIDGLGYGPGPWSYEALVKGDARSLSIAAASIIAKETRDALMIEYSKQFPGYGFEKHMGYPTAAHLKALEELGACAIHRRTFGPVRKILELNLSKIEA